MTSLVKRLTKNAAGDIAETVRFLAGVAGVWLLIVTVMFAPFHIPSESMQPTLEVGDRVLVSKWAYGYSRHSLPLGIGYWLPDSWNARILARDPERGDIVVFRSTPDRRNIIKRVIGLPGDIVAVVDGRLYINGEMLERIPVDERVYRTHEGPVVSVTAYEETLPEGRDHIIYERTDRDRYGPVEIPAGYVFVMGDNRDSSADSRFSPERGGPGYVRLSEVVGRAETVMFTFKRCRREEGLFCPSGRVWRGL